MKTTPRRIAAAGLRSTTPVACPLLILPCRAWAFVYSTAVQASVWFATSCGGYGVLYAGLYTSLKWVKSQTCIGAMFPLCLFLVVLISGVQSFQFFPATFAGRAA